MGEELNYASAEENHVNLVRAAAWHYGTWKRAIEEAGLDYDEVSIYKRWTQKRVIARIRELHAQGADLSWSKISTEGDPALAAAAVRSNCGFATWHEAVTAAGIDYDRVARYRHWTPERVVEEIQELARQKAPLSSKLVQDNHPPLYNAAKRRFGQWDAALKAAGIDPEKVRQRRRLSPTEPHRKRKNAEGKYTFDHLKKLEESNKKRRQPKKSLFPVPAAPSEEIPAPPVVEPRPLRRRDRKTGQQRVSARKREVYEQRAAEMKQRSKILAKAAKKPGVQPLPSGHAVRRQKLQEQQLNLELEENSPQMNTDKHG
jgi:hypothetical protein